MKAGPYLERVKRGDEYLASTQNKIVDAVNQATNYHVEGAEGYSLAGGQYLYVPSEEWCFASVTASDGSNGYSWTEQYPDAGGAWIDGARSGSPGSDVAREANAIEASTFPFKAILRRSVTSGEWIFFLDTCSSGVNL